LKNSEDEQKYHDIKLTSFDRFSILNYLFPYTSILFVNLIFYYLVLFIIALIFLISVI